MELHTAEDRFEDMEVVERYCEKTNSKIECWEKLSDGTKMIKVSRGGSQHLVIQHEKKLKSYIDGKIVTVFELKKRGRPKKNTQETSKQNKKPTGGNPSAIKT